MILRLDQFGKRNNSSVIKIEEKSSDVNYKSNLKINWRTPDLSKEISHYDDKAKIEFYQHNITIGNRDINKVKPRATKFYKYIIEPFKKGNLLDLPLFSEDEFNVNKIQNLMSYEYDNIVNGSYGKSYGESLVNMSEDLKNKGALTLDAPILIRFINFGETRNSSEDSYYLFSGNRKINLALHYNIPIKVWVIDLVPSRRDVRDFIEQSNLSSNPAEFKKLLKRNTGKETIDELSARERFTIIQSIKSF
jgi:hypothetical protein